MGEGMQGWSGNRRQGRKGMKRNEGEWGKKGQREDGAEGGKNKDCTSSSGDLATGDRREKEGDERTVPRPAEI